MTSFRKSPSACSSILYPHYLRPIPSMSVAEFQVDPATVKPDKRPQGGARLHAPLSALNGIPCKFRTCYDVTFWPLAVAEAEWTTPDRLKPPISRPKPLRLCASTAMRRGHRFPQALARFAALLPQRRKQPHPLALRALCRITARRSLSATPLPNRKCRRSIFLRSA